ncbi:hypothetical protein PFISCL1PPCAC_7552 [Pristionchus fissidentatus]|uniref:Stress-activated map kinase-interacting protein 1 n=1 Tax=Pristionchus fissidentatus TaxID=1538716 RepID=A0AAV5VCI2_9BILA|nr:hypothetical protein PFISCL1PPCAC_7552 [Pristionchus fissidentatus]
MAYLDDDEIIATIRHEMRLEDEEGRCNDVLPPVFRRAKNGGLPLDFRSLKRSDEGDEDGRQSPGYTIPVEEEVWSTSELIASRLRSRTADSGTLNGELDARKDSALCSLQADRELYVERSAAEIAERFRQRQQQRGEQSRLSRELEEASAATAGPESAYRAFLEHDASSKDPSAPAKRILIVYAIPEAESGSEEVTTITISIIASATVADLIGLACYRFAERTGVAPSAPLEQLELYIAEESGEIDDEFPPMESHKMVSEFGFPVLALKANDGDASSSRASSLTATIYLPDKAGTRFAIDCPSLLQPLRWLRDEAVKRKLEAMKNEEHKKFTMMAQYNLEHVDKPEAPLDLDKTIAAMGTMEYVLIRRNCSRGDFQPRSALPQEALPPTPNTAAGGMTFEFPVAVSASVRSMGTEETAIAAFTVDRLHKYKNKWPANLVLRWNWIEVTPVQTERRLSNRFQGGGQKSNMIAWEDLADARIRERRNPGGGLPTVQLSITWLPPPGVAQTPTTPLRKTSSLLFDTSPPSSAPHLGGGVKTLSDITMRYKDADKWKVLSLEMISYAEGDRAVRMLIEGIKQRNSPVSQAFLHSREGDIRPGAAAEAASKFQRTLSSARPTKAPKNERKRSSIMQLTSGIGRMFNRDKDYG